IDGGGGILMPGIIDAHTHLGIHEESVGVEGADYNETSNSVTPDLRAIDGIYPTDVAINDALKSGITAACVLPGSANVIGGAGVVIHTYGRMIGEMVLRENVGMKVAFGENPKRVYKGKDKAPSTRMATAALLREWLTKAKCYADKKQRAVEKGDVFEIDLKLEALLPVVAGNIPMRAHAHRADDIATAVRIAQECGVKIVIEHCTEGHLIADFLAEEQIPAIVGPSFSSRSKVELRERTFATPGFLDSAGVTVALMTDHPVIPLEHLPLVGALAVKAGMSEAAALRALTINPARILGLGDKLGSIEAGKDADLVLWSGHPFDMQSVATKVWIAGRQVI
ncbi:MAG: amidohydrolase, partial [Kiritimatiellia bacterium]